MASFKEGLSLFFSRYLKFLLMLLLLQLYKKDMFNVGGLQKDCFYARSSFLWKVLHSGWRLNKFFLGVQGKAGCYQSSLQKHKEGRSYDGAKAFLGKELNEYSRDEKQHGMACPRSTGRVYCWNKKSHRESSRFLVWAGVRSAGLYMPWWKLWV